VILKSLPIDVSIYLWVNAFADRSAEATKEENLEKNCIQIL